MIKNFLQEGLDYINGLESRIAELEQGVNGLIKEMSTMVKPPTERAKAIEAIITGGFVLDALAIPYVFGGETRTGMDCSGFTQFLFKHGAGISLPRTSKAQSTAGWEIDRSDTTKWQRGDLLFFDYSGDGVVDHVGIYLGDGTMLHTNTPATGINVKAVTVTDSLVAVRRIL